MVQKKTPDWKDISFLPMIGNLIDQAVSDSEKTYRSLLKTKTKPCVLDDFTIGRVITVNGEKKDNHWLFEEQVIRWKKLTLPQKTLNELSRLEKQLEKDMSLLNKILSLAEDLKNGTIKSLLAKDDMDLGFEIAEEKRTLSGLDPTGESEQSKQKSKKTNPAFSAERTRIVSMIDQKVKTMLKAKRDRLELLNEMYEEMTEFKKVMETSTPVELSELCRQYSGFHQFSQILEELASGIQSGKIKVPE